MSTAYTGTTETSYLTNSVLQQSVQFDVHVSSKHVS